MLFPLSVNSGSVIGLKGIGILVGRLCGNKVR
jgi:hypothetical protein